MAANNNISQPQLQKNRLPEKASYWLVLFADSFSPSESYIKEGNKNVQDVSSNHTYS